MTAPCPSCQRPTGNGERDEIAALRPSPTANLGLPASEWTVRDVVTLCAAVDFLKAERDAARAALAGAVVPQVLTEIADIHERVTTDPRGDYCRNCEPVSTFDGDVHPDDDSWPCDTMRVVISAVSS